MHVLMINSSPHQKGCTNRALEEIASALSEKGIESEILWIGKESLHGCIDCGYCFKHGVCVFNDDKVNALEGSRRDALILELRSTMPVLQGPQAPFWTACSALFPSACTSSPVPLWSPAEEAGQALPSTN